MTNSPQLQTEIAHIEDVADLAKLDEICFQTDRLSTKQFRHFTTSSTSEVCVVKEEKSLVAGAVLLFRKNSTLARIYSIAVSPFFRNRGIAQLLLAFVEKLCKKRGSREIRLEVRKDNVPAIKFYEKNGYQAFGEYKKFYEDGHDALRMRKEIV